MHYLAFNKEWFEKHQNKLLWLLRFKTFRTILRIDSDLPIVQILPNAYTVYLRHDKDRVHLQTDFRTHCKYSKRLYYAFRPLWWMMHGWDLVVDALIPKLSFGFSTLTKNPDPDPETNTVDGFVQNFPTGGTWAAARAAATGTTADDSATQGVFVQNRLAGTDWIINRAFLLFDTSSLTAAAIVSAAVLSVVPHDAAGGSDVDGMFVHIVASTPVSNTALATADFDQLGATSFANMAAWIVSDSTYRDFTLNASGIANVSKTAVSKFGAIGSLDLNGSPDPTGNNQCLARWADYAGTSFDPKLVVTYSLASPSLVYSTPGAEFRFKDQVIAY